MKISLIGCGWAARTLHVPAIEKAGVGELVAVSDPLGRAARGFKGAEVYADWRRMIAGSGCDVVAVASPPEFHTEQALAAIEAGKHVLVEKPLAPSAADARRIRDAARDGGRVAAMGFNLRRHRAFVEIRKGLENGRLGRVKEMNVVWTTGSGFGVREWVGERRRGGGALMDLGSHMIDLWRYVAGCEVARAEAVSRSVALDDEWARLEAVMENGAVARAELSLVGRDRCEVEVVGERGRVRVRPYGREWAASYVGQWREFAAAVRGEGEVASGLEDGVVAAEWLERVTQPLETRRAVEWAPEEFPLSVVATATKGYGAMRTTVAHLRRQTAAGRMELVLVGPTEESLRAPEGELEGFAAVRRVAVGAVTSIAMGNAAGVRRSRGRVVALAEDHCFPEPDWAQALIDAHEGDWTVVGPVVRNANPGSMVSEADFAIGYGPWMEPMEAREMEFLAGHNSSYKREALKALDGRLEWLMESETVLHMGWSAQGRGLRVEPGARVRHVNFSLWRSWLPVQFYMGRLFAGMRASTWSWKRRWFYTAASPLIPLVRFYRAVTGMWRPGAGAWRTVKTAPALAVGLALDGLGQMVGYAKGPGESMKRLAEYEFNRIEHVREEDRGLWLGEE